MSTTLTPRITAGQLKAARIRRAAGIRATVPPHRAAAHIAALRQAGMIDTEIRGAAHIGLGTYYRAARQQGPITRRTEARLLAVRPASSRPPRSTASVPPHGTRRRIQGLVAAGWPPAVLARTLGMHLQQLHELANRHEQCVAVATAERVRLATRDLWGRQPETCGATHASTARARQLAARHGWHPLAVWDDIDDPDEQPRYGEHESRLTAVVEDTAELIAEGLSREGIAARLGIQWDAVRQAHRRSGVSTPEPRWWQE
ncbi:hypothetical protein ACGF0D_10610 [Kitasatospora sp. NPDC048298]|uniref:hypothetical protein n=1 Tax=Kitasatospora sp. NPDC048298 TaxID=3364049 RepID=UPI0037141768